MTAALRRSSARSEQDASVATLIRHTVHFFDLQIIGKLIRSFGEVEKRELYRERQFARGNKTIDYFFRSCLAAGKAKWTGSM